MWLEGEDESEADGARCGVCHGLFRVGKSKFAGVWLVDVIASYTDKTLFRDDLIRVWVVVVEADPTESTGKAGGRRVEQPVLVWIGAGEGGRGVKRVGRTSTSKAPA